MTMLRLMRLPATLFLLCFFATTASAGHEEFINDEPLKDGPSVTAKCLECHEKEAQDFMKTVHWTWSKVQYARNGEKIEIGKVNALNNFCIGLPANWPRCTSCHAGYGFKDASFDFTKTENIDCLVCHDTTGTYKKFPSAAGHPVYEGQKKEFPPGKPWKPADLVKIAQSVGPTSRATCGTCHFYGGGGDHVKHGDLDSSMVNPTPEIDIHMGGEQNMNCQSCHQAKDHFLKGEGGSVSTAHSETSHLDCTGCHTGKVHKNALVNRHTQKIACQTCHIPIFAKAQPTKVWWDWSTAGQDKPVEKDEYGKPLYDKMKGDFKWAKDVTPSYMWFNGTINRYIAGDKIDPAQVVKLTSVNGDRNDPKAKIFPFKVMRGKQAYDSENNIIAFVQVFGPPDSDAYWQKYDWPLAIASGMKAAGQPFSGKYGFVETSMVWPVHHMVAPKSNALKCNDCHGDTGRLDWKGLGYEEGDPRKARKK